MNQNKLVQQLELMIEKSRRTLKSARDLFEHEDYESASSRAYYAVFYSVEAILLTKGLSFSTHSSVMNAFSQYFIKEGIFPESFGSKIRRLKEDRETGDYNYYETIDKEGAEKDIRMAEEIVGAIEKYIKV